ncbi:hypothetical protein PMIN07_008052 [Paraphaeosphaeria minitans]
MSSPTRAQGGLVWRLAAGGWPTRCGACSWLLLARRRRRLVHEDCLLVLVVLVVVVVVVVVVLVVHVHVLASSSSSSSAFPHWPCKTPALLSNRAPTLLSRPPTADSCVALMVVVL